MGFWQKDVPGHAPKWVSRWTYTGHEGKKDYVVVDKVATLAWLAQEAALELHPWTSRTISPHEPTFALIDVDPGDNTTWEEVLTLTRLYRTALEHLGVIGLPKTTGKRGLQVWVPVRRGYRFDETRDWVEQLSLMIGRLVPDMVSWEWAKRDRKGRARLDFTQNAVNKTLVAPYSVRPSSRGAGLGPDHAGTSWTTLPSAPSRWTIQTLGARVKQGGGSVRSGHRAGAGASSTLMGHAKRAAVAGLEGRHRGALLPRVVRVSGPRWASRRQCCGCAFWSLPGRRDRH